jgi:DNA-3-methyladenine glycosylase
MKFREKVLATVRRIPPGETATYEEIARRAESPKAARAVGRLMATNQDPTVPCHRVVPTTGGFGEFSRGGTKAKQRILEAERRKEKLTHLDHFPRGRALGREFFDRPTLEVAHDLLGKFLVRRIGRKTVALMILETEAYDGFEDRASHASRGETKRNAPMFAGPGRWYAYFTYGIHWMLNAVTGAKGYPAAVLIRAAGKFDGPAKLTKALNITGTQNDKNIVRTTGLWIEDRGAIIPNSQVQRLPRVGVDYAGPWAKKLYRFRVRGLLPKAK